MIFDFRSYLLSQISDPSRLLPYVYIDGTLCTWRQILQIDVAIGIRSQLILRAGKAEPLDYGDQLVDFSLIGGTSGVQWK